VLMIVIAAACRAQAATESGWTILQLPPGTLTDLRAVDVPAANVVVLGASGTILRTTDRGATCKRTLDRSRALGESATRTVRGPKGLQHPGATFGPTRAEWRPGCPLQSFHARPSDAYGCLALDIAATVNMSCEGPVETTSSFRWRGPRSGPGLRRQVPSAKCA
jgi:hypothetical protein